MQAEATRQGGMLLICDDTRNNRPAAGSSSAWNSLQMMRDQLCAWLRRMQIPDAARHTPLPHQAKRTRPYRFRPGPVVEPPSK